MLLKALLERILDSIWIIIFKSEVGNDILEVGFDELE